jgi:hypothetical protein
VTIDVIVSDSGEEEMTAIVDAEARLFVGQKLEIGGIGEYWNGLWEVKSIWPLMSFRRFILVMTRNPPVPTNCPPI